MGTRSTFVQVESGKDGIGKLVEIRANVAEIEYFESPAGPILRTVHVPVSTVKEVQLSEQTRVFWCDPTRQAWLAGRVDGGFVGSDVLQTNEDQYCVSFPNGRHARVPASQLYVRWSHPIQDPTDYLAGRITDTPFFFDGRSRLLQHLSAQRAAFGGLTGLASSAVELLEHQIAIAKQVLSDPVSRYLLADEVGLGKTIEAGILIRQHAIDYASEANVLILVPDHLVSQWLEELENKFFLGSDPRVRVLPYSSLNGEPRWARPTMLVVDEAHRIAASAFSEETFQQCRYRRLESVAREAPRLLLLSGTPVLHQEDQFLAMLHLLDPNAYLLTERDSFRRRVAERQGVAEAVLDLADDASTLFAMDAIGRLESTFSADKLLLELCGAARLRMSAETDDTERIKALRTLRIHLHETYRLHRRLLRTRRSDPRVEIYLPQRKGIVNIEHGDESRLESSDFLSTWRGQLGADELLDVSNCRQFEEFVVAALSHPAVLVRQIELRLSSLQVGVSGTKSAFEGEEQFLRQRRDLIVAQLKRDDRAHKLADWFRSGSDVRKAVVFVDDAEIARVVTATLRQRLAPAPVVQFDGNSETLRKFEKSKNLAVLVCDSNAEEGLNLQRCGAIVVHYDLPLDPSRIEQRIGRIDRIEARDQVRNLILTSRQPYEREWVTCLDQAVRIFNRSTAPLQYALTEATRRIRSRLLQDGTGAIEEESLRLSDPKTGIEFELKQIEAQEAVDSMESSETGDDDFFTRILEEDDAIANTGAKSLDAWVVDRLQFDREKVRNGVIRYVHDRRRPTLIPVLETLVKFRRSIDTDDLRRARDRIPLSQMTFERSIAELEGVELLRVGHPFLDALQSEIRCDDRGTAFALWRYIPQSASKPRVFLRFDFLIEADIESALRVDESLSSSFGELRRLADDLFPVSYRTLWLNSDLDEVKNSNLITILALPYSRLRRPTGLADTNIRFELWDRVEAMVSLSDWEGLCRRARKRAEQLLRNEDSFRENCSKWAGRTRDKAFAAASMFASRLARLSGTAKTEEERAARQEAAVYKALSEGIEKPQIRADSAGLIVLAPMPLVKNG